MLNLTLLRSHFTSASPNISLLLILFKNGSSFDLSACFEISWFMFQKQMFNEVFILSISRSITMISISMLVWYK